MSRHLGDEEFGHDLKVPEEGEDPQEAQGPEALAGLLERARLAGQLRVGQLHLAVKP